MLLVPCGWLYGVINLVRVWLYSCGFFKSYRSSVPVLSVGNIAVGGTGKTPLVDYLLKQQQQMGRKVAVVSRGYGGEGGEQVSVACAGAGPVLSAKQCGDEPYLLAMRNPQAVIIVAPERAAGIRFALENFAVDLVLLDDGYQHLGVQRDLNLLLFDSRCPVGNGHLLPAGLLREFPSSARRADLCIMTRCSTDAEPLKQSVARLCRGKQVLCAGQFLSDSALSLTGDQFTGAVLRKSRCVAFAGIANPDDFFSALTAMGITLQATLALPDHCEYSVDQINRINSLAQGADLLLTTEKDAVKLNQHSFSLPCCSLALKFELREAEILRQRIEVLFTDRGAGRDVLDRCPPHNKH